MLLTNKEILSVKELKGTSYDSLKELKDTIRFECMDVSETTVFIWESDTQDNTICVSNGCVSELINVEYTISKDKLIVINVWEYESNSENKSSEKEKKENLKMKTTKVYSFETLPTEALKDEAVQRYGENLSKQLYFDIRFKPGRRVGDNTTSWDWAYIYDVIHKDHGLEYAEKHFTKTVAPGKITLAMYERVEEFLEEHSDLSLENILEAGMWSIWNEIY